MSYKEDCVIGMLVIKREGQIFVVSEKGYGKRSETARSVASAIIGSFDAVGGKQYCRLTAFSGKEFDKYNVGSVDGYDIINKELVAK